MTIKPSHLKTQLMKCYALNSNTEKHFHFVCTWSYATTCRVLNPWLIHTVIASFSCHTSYCTPGFISIEWINSYFSWNHEHENTFCRAKKEKWVCFYANIIKCAYTYGRNANPFQILVKQIYVFVFLLNEKALLFLQARFCKP